MLQIVQFFLIFEVFQQLKPEEFFIGATYHPAANGTAKRLIQTFKKIKQSSL